MNSANLYFYALIYVPMRVADKNIARTEDYGFQCYLVYLLACVSNKSKF